MVFRNVAAGPIGAACLDDRAFWPSPIGEVARAA
jgi:hypothetical protein